MDGELGCRMGGIHRCGVGGDEGAKCRGKRESSVLSGLVARVWSGRGV